MEIANMNPLLKKVKSVHDEGKQIIKSTINDVGARAPGWIAQEVTQVYNIKKSEITPSSKNSKGKKMAGSIKVKGNNIKNFTITYTGRLLTHTHFGMTPKRPTAGNGYTLKAQVIKGEKKTLGKVKKLSAKQRAALGKNFTRSGERRSAQSPIMLMPTGNTYIPFQRRSFDRKDVWAIKTLSVPQMITSDRTNEAILKRIDTETAKRLEHYLSRVAGK